MKIHEKSNISGKCNKQPLNPRKMSEVNKATFQMYPCASEESKLSEWRKCHKKIAADV